MLRQPNVYPHLVAIEEQMKFTAHDRFLYQVSMSWDVSEPQIFSPLLAGATMCIASSEVRKDPTELANFIKQATITFTYFTPTQFAILLEVGADILRKCEKWRLAWFAGEVLPARLVQALYELNMPIEIWNAYGPCETQVATSYKVPRPNKTVQSIPIGFSVPSSHSYVLDNRQNPVPVGVQGEIYLGGPQTAIEYINRRDMTDAAFIDDPHPNEIFDDKRISRGKMFKTGDMGRFDVDGVLHFLGRVAGDKMVKLRGLRIDCGEIEQLIFDIGQAKGEQLLTGVAVVARHLDGESESEDNNLADERQLIAFLFLRKQNKSRAKELAQAAHKSLPDKLNKYMIPTGYCSLDVMPTTVGGKADRQSLLNRSLDNLIRPGLASSETVTNEKSHQEAEINLQDLRAKLLPKVIHDFKILLRLPEDSAIDSDSNFFDLGGTSLLLMRLQSILHKELGKKVRLNKLFAKPTPLGVVSALHFECSGDKSDDAISRLSDDAKFPHHSQTNSDVYSANAGIIRWENEIVLPDDSRFQIPVASAEDMFDAPEPTDIFLTGADTFVGIHVLAEILEREQTGKIHVIGTEAPLSKEELVSKFRHFQLLSGKVNEQTLLSRVRVHSGCVTQPQFGFRTTEFAMLGSRIHTIYNMGVPVSLLKSYNDLCNADVRPICDLIELAACGSEPTAIRHLSTWTVPHLQSWHETSRRYPGKLIRNEQTPESYYPPSNNDQGYIKVRWVTEMLLIEAAKRGFDVKMFRSSAMTGALSTGVPEPRDGIIQQYVMGMLITGVVPKISDLVVDFVPVDYLASTIYALGRYDTRPKNMAGIYHITNSRPMTLTGLLKIMPEVRDKKTGGAGELSSDEWFDKVEMEAADGPGDALRWNAMRDLFQSGHNMWGLDDEATREAMARAGKRVDDCPSIDAPYLKKLLKNWTSQRTV